MFNKHTEIINQVVMDNNYKNSFPVPEILIEHKRNHPDSFYIQVLGVRGAGKSTFVNNIMRRLKVKSGIQDYEYKKAETGAFECTKEPQFIDITPLVTDLKPPYKSVFLVDQPGIGGKTILEADFLRKFGPGL